MRVGTRVYLWKGQGQLVEVGFSSTIWNLRLSGCGQCLYPLSIFFFFFFMLDFCLLFQQETGRCRFVRSWPGLGLHFSNACSLFQIGKDSCPPASSQAHELQHNRGTFFYWSHWQCFNRQHNSLHPQDGDSRI